MPTTPTSSWSFFRVLGIRGFARQYSFLENADRGDRSRPDVCGGLDLRAVGLWEESRSSRRVSCSACRPMLSRSTSRPPPGRPKRAAARLAETQSGPAGPSEPDGDAGCATRRSPKTGAVRPQSADRPRSVRAVAACQREEHDTDLVQALRRCDAGRVQCLVMVRDDFWLAITRFLRELEIRCLEGQNCALVHLFDTDHARKVLAAFGRAFARFLETTLASEQRQFLDLAVTGLAQDSKVVSVRLAVFAEMVEGAAMDAGHPEGSRRHRGGRGHLSRGNLQRLDRFARAPISSESGPVGVGGRFLPPYGTTIRRHMHRTLELLDASGYVYGRPSDFDHAASYSRQ